MLFVSGAESYQKEVKLSVSDSPINTTTCCKYLGVHLDPTLNFETHFQKLYKKNCTRRQQEEWASHPSQHW